MHFGRYWHETDLRRCLLSGRYRGLSGRDANMAESTLLTRSGSRGHWRTAVATSQNMQCRKTYIALNRYRGSSVITITIPIEALEQRIGRPLTKLASLPFCPHGFGGRTCGEE